MTAPSTVAIPAPSAPRSPTFHMCLNYVTGRPREVLRRVRLSPTGIGDASEAPHRAITLPTRSAEPRARRERTLPFCHSPAGRTQRPLPTGRAAMAENSVKQAESAETYKMGDELLARAKSRGTIERRRATPPAPPRRPDGPDALRTGHGKSPAREGG